MESNQSTLINSSNIASKLELTKEVSFTFIQFAYNIKLYEDYLLVDITHRDDFYTWSEVVNFNDLNKPEHKLNIDAKTLHEMFSDDAGNNIKEGYSIVYPKSYKDPNEALVIEIKIDNDSYVKINESKVIILHPHHESNKKRLERKVDYLKEQLEKHMEDSNKSDSDNDDDNEIDNINSEICTLSGQIKTITETNNFNKRRYERKIRVLKKQMTVANNKIDLINNKLDEHLKEFENASSDDDDDQDQDNNDKLEETMQNVESLKEYVDSYNEDLGLLTNSVSILESLNREYSAEILYLKSEINKLNESKQKDMNNFKTLENIVNNLKNDFMKMSKQAEPINVEPSKDVVLQSLLSKLYNPRYTFYYGESPEECKMIDITEYIIRKYKSHNSAFILIPAGATPLEYSTNSHIYCHDGTTLERLSKDVAYSFKISTH